MSKPQNVAGLLDQALGQAFIAQFGLLFSVLMQAEDLEKGLERFARGLQKLLDTGTNVAEIISSVEGEA